MMAVVVVVATTYQRHFHLGHNQLSVPKHIIIVPQHAVDSPEPVRDSFDRVLCFHSASRALCATIIFIGQIYRKRPHRQSHRRTIGLQPARGTTTHGHGLSAGNEQQKRPDT